MIGVEFQLRIHTPTRMLDIKRIVFCQWVPRAGDEIEITDDGWTGTVRRVFHRLNGGALVRMEVEHVEEDRVEDLIAKAKEVGWQ